MKFIWFKTEDDTTKRKTGFLLSYAKREPPFHPNCRCTTVPYDEDWNYKGQRIAKEKNGKYYYVTVKFQKSEFT